MLHHPITTEAPIYSTSVLIVEHLELCLHPLSAHSCLLLQNILPGVEPPESLLTVQLLDLLLL